MFFLIQCYQYKLMKKIKLIINNLLCNIIAVLLLIIIIISNINYQS